MQVEREKKEKYTKHFRVKVDLEEYRLRQFILYFKPVYPKVIIPKS